MKSKTDWNYYLEQKCNVVLGCDHSAATWCLKLRNPEPKLYTLSQVIYIYVP